MKRMLLVGVMALFLVGCATERTVYLRADGTTEKVVTTPVPVVIETTQVQYEEIWVPRPVVWIDVHGYRHHGGHYERHYRRR